MKRYKAAALAATAVLMLVAPAVDARAARAEGRGSSKALYTARAYSYDTCTAGTTCEHAAAADGSGAHSTSASAARPALSEAREHSTAVAQATKTITVDKPVKELVVTFTWHVTRAQSRAVPASAEGATVARAWGRGAVTGCTGCTLTHETDDSDELNPADNKGRYLVDSYAQNFVEQSHSLENTEVFHRITLTGPNGGLVPAGKYTLTANTIAFSAVWGACNANSTIHDLIGDEEGCRDELFGHAGTATAEAVTTVKSISHTVTP